MRQSKTLKGGNSLPKGSSDPGTATKDSSAKAVNTEKSSPNAKESKPLGPMKGKIDGMKVFTEGEHQTTKSLEHPKPADAMKTHRVG